MDLKLRSCKCLHCFNLYARHASLPNAALVVCSSIAVSVTPLLTSKRRAQFIQLLSMGVIKVPAIVQAGRDVSQDIDCWV
jgi:hypothetical protein